MQNQSSPFEVFAEVPKKISWLTQSYRPLEFAQTPDLGCDQYYAKE